MINSRRTIDSKEKIDTKRFQRMIQKYRINGFEIFLDTKKNQGLRILDTEIHCIEQVFICEAPDSYKHFLNQEVVFIKKFEVVSMYYDDARQ